MQSLRYRLCRFSAKQHLLVDYKSDVKYKMHSSLIFQYIHISRVWHGTMLLTPSEQLKAKHSARSWVICVLKPLRVHCLNIPDTAAYLILMYQWQQVGFNDADSLVICQGGSSVK